MSYSFNQNKNQHNIIWQVYWTGQLYHQTSILLERWQTCFVDYVTSYKTGNSTLFVDTVIVFIDIM